MTTYLNKIKPHTQWDIDNRIENFSKIMNEDEWYSFMNELGELNDNTEEGWNPLEIMQMADTNGYGVFYVTTHCVKIIMDKLQVSYNNE